MESYFFRVSFLPPPPRDSLSEWPGWEGGAHDFGTGGKDGDDDDGDDSDRCGDYDDGGDGDGDDGGDDGGDQVGREGRTTLGRGGKESKARQLTSVPSEKDSQLNNNS